MKKLIIALSLMALLLGIVAFGYFKTESKSNTNYADTEITDENIHVPSNISQQNESNVLQEDVDESVAEKANEESQVLDDANSFMDSFISETYRSEWGGFCSGSN